jgi:hypothetical protein
MGTKKKESVKERLAKKRKEIASRGKGLDFIILKEGTLRVRPLPVGEDEEFGFEITQFYLGGTIKGVISPSSVGLPCALMEKYLELKDSKDAGDKSLAKALSPKKKTVVPVIVYADTKGKTVDTEKSTENGKLFLITSGVYASMIDSYLDEDDWGDFTDPINGYDFKVTRTGSGRFDTEYSCVPCPKSPLPKPYKNKVINLKEMVMNILPTYEETLEKLNEFLNEAPQDQEEEEERPARLKKKKSRKSDI